MGYGFKKLSMVLFKVTANAKALFRARLKGRISVNRKKERKMNTEQTTKKALTEINTVLANVFLFIKL